jgi:hypothetical protein
MSVTAIQNPLKSADVLLTYPTSKGNLALEHRPFPSGPDPPPFTDNGNSGGPIMTDSGVSVVAHDNDVRTTQLLSLQNLIVTRLSFMALCNGQEQAA